MEVFKVKNKGRFKEKDCKVLFPLGVELLKVNRKRL